MKKIIVNAYTNRQEIFEYSKLKPSSEFVPSWWKDLPSKPELVNTPEYLGYKLNMRGCPGFVDLYKLGYMLPLWSDLLVEVGAKGDTSYRWQFSDQYSDATVHPDHQRNKFLPDTEYQHIKINAPWLLETKEDLNWAVVPPTWNVDNPENIIIPPGVLNFKYQRQINANLLIKRDKESKIIKIKFHQPLMQIIPLTEKPVEFRFHLISNEEWENRKNAGGYGCIFSRSYYKLKSLMHK